MTRRQAQAAKAKAGLPATITKDKLRQALERWVNKQFRGPSSPGHARDPYPPPSDRGGERRTQETQGSPSNRRPPMRGGWQEPPQPPPQHQGEAGSSADQTSYSDQWTSSWQNWNQGWNSDQWTESGRHPTQQMGGWNQQTAPKKKKSPANLLRGKLRAQVKQQLRGATFVDT